MSTLGDVRELTSYSVIIVPFFYPKDWSEKKIEVLRDYVEGGGRLLLCGEIPSGLQNFVGITSGPSITPPDGSLRITLTEEGKKCLMDGRWEEGYLLVGGKKYVDGAVFSIPKYENVNGIELGSLEDPASGINLGAGVVLNRRGLGEVLWFNGRPFWTIGSWSSEVYYFSDLSPWNWEKFEAMYKFAHKPLYTTKLAVIAAIKYLLHSQGIPLIAGAFWKVERENIPLGVLFGEHDFEPSLDIYREQYIQEVLNLDRIVGLPAAYMPTYDVITLKAVDVINAYGQELGLQTWKVSQGYGQIREEAEKIRTLSGRALLSFDQHGDRPGGNTYFGMDFLLWMERLGYGAHIESYHNAFDAYPFRIICYDRSLRKLRLMESMYQLGGHVTVEDQNRSVQNYVEEFRKFIEKLGGIRIFLNHGVYYGKKADWYKEILTKIVHFDCWKVHPSRLYDWLIQRRQVSLSYYKKEDAHYEVRLTNHGERALEGFIIEVYSPPGKEMKGAFRNVKRRGDCLLAEIPKLEPSTTVKVKLHTG